MEWYKKRTQNENLEQETFHAQNGTQHILADPRSPRERNGLFNLNPTNVLGEWTSRGRSAHLAAGQQLAQRLLGKAGDQLHRRFLDVSTGSHARLVVVVLSK